MELLGGSVTSMVAAIRDRELSPVELVEAHVRRAEELNGDLNAIVVPRFDQALEEARAAERSLARGDGVGPLHGIPYTAKECIEVAGTPCTDGSRLFEGNVSLQDAVVVESLRAAGAILIGKTNIPEFAFHYDSNNLVYGATLNPHDRSRSAGGSSGGEAAALASGMTAFSVGSDYGGSIRVPCHFCGVVGIKPGPGVVPYAGHFPPQHPVSIQRWSMIGPMARHVEDLELLLPVFARPNLARDSGVVGRSFEREDVDGVRVAAFEDDGLVPVDDACRGAVRLAAESLREDGHEVVEERAPLQAEVRDAFMAIAMAETAAMLVPFIGDRMGELSPQIARLLEQTAEADLTLAHYLRRMVEVTELQHTVYAWLERHPIAISPVAALPAFALGTETLRVGGEDYEEIDFFSLSTYVNAMALPAAAVPITRSEDGLPVAVQVIGRRGREMQVLAVARKLEAAFGGWMDPDESAARAAAA
jgi:Asp-tRNA(Asn)/Glu-tRNA(Gln) amidotransferase A subunit family amidase